jgi:hypothetical protein
VLSDTINVNGRLKIKKYDESNNLIEEHDFKNLVVYSGKKLIASRLFADTTPAIIITNASGTGTIVTYTYESRSVAPYYVGQKIDVVGMGNTQFNGRFRVLTCSQTQVTVDSSATGSPGVMGTIASLNNGTITKMAVGEGPTVASLSDTGLYVQKGIVDMFSIETSFEDGDSSISYIALFPAGNGTNTPGVPLTEAGLFTTDGIMMCRTVFTPIEKLSNQSLEIFWTVTIA